MPLLNRTPRRAATPEEVIARLAAHLEQAAADLRRLAGEPTTPAAQTPSPAADPLDAIVIDPRHLAETEEEFARLDRERHG